MKQTMADVDWGMYLLTLRTTNDKEGKLCILEVKALLDLQCVLGSASAGLICCMHSSASADEACDVGKECSNHASICQQKRQGALSKSWQKHQLCPPESQ